MKLNNKNNSLFTAFVQFPQMPAVISPNRELTFAQLRQCVIKTGDRLSIEGIERGDKVAILARTNIEYIILLLALWKAGAIAAPFSARWPKDQVDNALEELNCRTCILGQEFVKLKFTFPAKVLALEELVKPDDEMPANNSIDLSVARDQLATIIFTSGSTGSAKAAVHSIGNHFFNALGSNSNIPFAPGDRWLLSLPLYHVGGMAIIFRSLLSGGSVAIPDRSLSLQENLAGLHITHLSLVATQLYRLLENYSTGSISLPKAILLGGSAIPPSLIRRAVEYKLPIFTSYGSTEMASQITTTRPGDNLQHLLTSGRLLPHRKLKIALDGEILVGGDTLFQGYLENGICKSAKDPSDWFHTGDLGELDKDGYLHVIGRKDNMFISGGENIHPEEIERHLLQMDEIAQAIVVPVNDEIFGKRPAAFIRYKEKIHPELIRKHLLKLLPKFKTPDYFFELPISDDSERLKADRHALTILANAIIYKDSQK